MKDILVIREKKNADEAILGFIRSKYDSKIISFDSKQAENLLMTEGIRIIVVFMDNTAASSLVELRRMIMYFKNVHFCLLGTEETIEKHDDLCSKEYVHCIETPLHVTTFQKKFEFILNQYEELSPIINNSSERKFSVLLVDDDPICLRNMMNWLKNFYQVAVVKSGAACISYLVKAQPDLILLDYEMPVCNGVQTLEMIRSEPEYADIPVIFLTAVSDTEKVKEALKLKPQGYILKNTDRVDFLNKVNAVFGI